MLWNQIFATKKVYIKADFAIRGSWSVYRCWAKSQCLEASLRKGFFVSFSLRFASIVYTPNKIFYPPSFLSTFYWNQFFVIVYVPRTGNSRIIGWKDEYRFRLAHCPHSPHCELWVLPIDHWPFMRYSCCLVDSFFIHLVFLPLLSILPLSQNHGSTRMTGFFVGNPLAGTCQGTDLRGKFPLVWGGRLYTTCKAVEGMRHTDGGPTPCTSYHYWVNRHHLS